MAEFFYASRDITELTFSKKKNKKTPINSHKLTKKKLKYIYIFVFMYAVNQAKDLCNFLTRKRKKIRPSSVIMESDVISYGFYCSNFIKLPFPIRYYMININNYEY